MLTSGDVITVDVGTPVGREAGYRHRAVIVTAQRLLDASPSVVHVVPLTSTLRDFGSEVGTDAVRAHRVARGTQVVGLDGPQGQQRSALPLWSRGLCPGGQTGGLAEALAALASPR